MAPWVRPGYIDSARLAEDKYSAITEVRVMGRP